MTDYTLVIPTHNRPALLARLVRFFDALGVEFPILVLDSSASKAASENGAAIRATSLDITHQPFDEALPVAAKVSRGVASVRTPYFSFCADDDVVFPSAIEEAVAFLRAHDDYQVAQGYCFGFSETDATFTITSVVYSNPSVDQESPLGRLHALISQYQPIFYGVTRTETWHRSMKRVDHVEGFLFKEFLPACETAILGKIKRLRRLYSGRRLDNEYADWGNARNFTGHPVRWVLREPAHFFASYVGYRNAIVDALHEARALDGAHESVERGLDVLHLGYLMLDPAMAYRHAEEVLGLTDATRTEEILAESRLVDARSGPILHPQPSVQPGVVSITDEASRRAGRQYRLSQEFIGGLAERGRSPLLDRPDVLAAIRTLNVY